MCLANSKDVSVKKRECASIARLFIHYSWEVIHVADLLDDSVYFKIEFCMELIYASCYITHKWFPAKGKRTIRITFFVYLFFLLSQLTYLPLKIITYRQPLSLKFLIRNLTTTIFKGLHPPFRIPVQNNS